MDQNSVLFFNQKGNEQHLRLPGNRIQGLEPKLRRLILYEDNVATTVKLMGTKYHR